MMLKRLRMKADSSLRRLHEKYGLVYSDIFRIFAFFDSMLLQQAEIARMLDVDVRTLICSTKG